MGRIDDNQKIQTSALNRANELPQPKKAIAVKKPQPKPVETVNAGEARSNYKFYGQQQKERLNAELIAYGAGSSSAFRDGQLSKVTV